MKYLVAATAADLDAKISKRFGHAGYFLIIEQETLDFTTISGIGEESSFHGIGNLAAQGIERVIVGNVGPAVFNDMINAGWSVYSCHNLTVREAVEQVHSGLISPLNAPTMKRSVREGGQGQIGGGHMGGGRGSGQGRRRL